MGVIVAACLGCSGASQPNRIEPEGFLPDYERLKPGSEGWARLRYRDPSARLESYEATLLEPVQIWRSLETEGLSSEDGRRLANRLYSLLYARLSRDFRMVRVPSQGTLRIAAALTGALSSSAVLDTISSVPPQTGAVAEVRGLETGKAAFVGEASIEAQISDAVSGEVLMEAVDRRVGRKRISAATDSWSDVDQAFVYWADRLGFALCMERKRTGCVAP